MCTVVVHVETGRVLLAANRDERVDRPWDPPAEYWPGIVGGRDRTAGGTWMAVNRSGVVDAVLNRLGTLGPAAGKRSRGELPLMALAHTNAKAAAEAITRIEAGQWRAFNMVVADSAGAWFVRGTGSGNPTAMPLPEGVTMVTAYDPNDLASARVERHLPRFQTAPATIEAWAALLADSGGDAAQQINVRPRGGFGTVSAAVMLLAAGKAPDWHFAAGPSDQADFFPLA
jgi:hypothetical protein